jgi:hypothetical protein
MNATRQRRALLAEDLLTSAGAVPHLLRGIAEVLRQPQLTATHALEVESIAERIELLFLSIKEAGICNHQDRLIASVERLREEIAEGEAVLDRVFKAIE